MAKRITLTKKQQTEYNKLFKKFDITKREFVDYYESVRKANAKGRRLAKQKSSLYAPKFTLKTSHFTARKEFLKHRKSVNSVLQRNYTTKQNVELRERFYKNLEDVLGKNNAKPLIEEFKKMSNAEYKDFSKENADLNEIIYGSGVAVADFIDLTQQKMANRLEQFAKAT